MHVQTLFLKMVLLIVSKTKRRKWQWYGQGTIPRIKMLISADSKNTSIKRWKDIVWKFVKKICQLQISPIGSSCFEMSFVLYRKFEKVYFMDVNWSFEIICKVRGWIGVTIGKIFVLVYFMFQGIWIILEGGQIHQIYFLFDLTLH